MIFALAALLVVALVLASTGCASDGAGGGTDDSTELSGALYADTMGDICASTTARLDRLPSPPTDISRADWAGEVSRALRDEAAAFDAIRVGDSRRDDHASFVENTEDQAAQWLTLSEVLAGEAADDEALSQATTEIRELTLGRNDLAVEMALGGCTGRELS